jgi:ribosome-associated toxin RatA of RatAB toxin-antitoxin module
MKREKSSVDEKAVAKKGSNLKSGWVSTLCGVNQAFVHLDEHFDGLSRMMNEMFHYYGKKTRKFLKNLKNQFIN